MIYIQQVSIVNFKEDQTVDLKAECKLVAPQFVRRTDDFIQLAILGVEQIKRLTPIAMNTAIYLTSGQGNLGVFERLCKQRSIEKSPPKPVDFINSLSNTAGFYLGKFLNLESKNSNLSHHSFVVEMALLLAQSDLLLKKEKTILFGGVDQLLESSEFMRNVLGVKESIQLGQGSNWMLLSNESKGAIACLELDNNEMNLSELREYLASQQGDYRLAFSPIADQNVLDTLLKEVNQPRFTYEEESGFYETVVLYALNQFIQSEKGKLLFIDYFEDKYRVIEIETC